VSTPCYFIHLSSVIIDHGCEKSGCHVVQMSELCNVVSSAYNLLHVNLTATRILRLLLVLWKICGPPSQTSPVRWGVDSYAIFSILMLLSPSQLKAFTSTSCSQILSVYLCPQYRAREEIVLFSEDVGSTYERVCGHWWNNTDKEKLKCTVWDKCRFFKMLQKVVHVVYYFLWIANETKKPASLMICVQY